MVDVANVDINSKAYCKVMLHSAKHPSKDVIGILLGIKQDEKMIVKDAVPFFHLAPLAPMMEVAMSMVEKYVSLHEDLEIVGAYYARSNPEHANNIHGIVSKICDKIQDQLEVGSVLLQQSNDLLDDPTNHTLKAFGKDSGGRYKKKIGISVSTNCVATLNKLLLEDIAISDVYDMDDHFDDIRKDWTNKKLNSLLGY